MAMRGARRLALGVARMFVARCFLALCGFVGCASCTLVEPGHVGIRIKRAGSGRGVQDAPIVSGWVAYNPLTETVVEFPTTVQTAVWTQNAHEGAPVDESITFTSREGVTVSSDVGLSYHVEPDHAARLYARFRQTDLPRLTDGYVRNLVRDALNESASAMTIQEIYGAGKTRLLHDSLAVVRSRLGNDGFAVDQLSFQGALRLPQNVIEAINQAIEATQHALQAQNRVAQVEAEASQRVAEARGQAEASRQRAQGDADALMIRTRADSESRLTMARAEARVNETIRLSTSPEVLRYRVLNRWNGVLPTVSGGSAMPMLTMDVGTALALPEAERRRARLQRAARGGAARTQQRRRNRHPRSRTVGPRTRLRAPTTAHAQRERG